MNMRGSTTKRSGRVWIVLSVLLLSGWVGGHRAEAQHVTLEAMLIQATDRPQAMDQRLDKIEYRLRRVFAFEHYGFMGESRTILSLPSETTVALGHGYSLRVNASAQDGRIRAQVQWIKGESILLNTSVTQKRGVPSILGGPPYNDGTLILVLQFN